eukprot:6352212-Pyramimonas_sp.AAC.2
MSTACMLQLFKKSSKIWVTPPVSSLFSVGNVCNPNMQIIKGPYAGQPFCLYIVISNARACKERANNARYAKMRHYARVM